MIPNFNVKDCKERDKLIKTIQDIKIFSRDLTDFNELTTCKELIRRYEHELQKIDNHC